MRILFASSEVHPFSKTGGLADMVGALAKAAARAGHEVGVVSPLYRGIRERFPAVRRVEWHLELPLGGQRVGGELWAFSPESRLTFYFVGQPGFFDRNGLYNERGVDYGDNAERFFFFSKAVVHLARYLPLQPEILHVNDWQTGVVPLLVRHQQQVEAWSTVPAVVFTIHNLAYQGWFAPQKFELLNVSPAFWSDVEHHGGLNCMKVGIALADVLTTVSPRYAREVLTPEYGEGLDWLLRQRQARFFGILNGVDYDEWKTTDNPHLKYPYSIRNLSGKARNKAALQEELGLPVRPNAPLFATISRLTEQKGISIELAALEEMLHSDIQFVLLGSGEPHFERAFLELAARFPQKAAVRLGYDTPLSHRIEAGSDFYLMPSKFEPCGLNQMFSLRYGTIPIVRAVGGLADTVVDAAENPTCPTGIKFHSFSAAALVKAMRKALAIFADPNLLMFYRRNGMRMDFSWERTVREYEAVYSKAKEHG
ncbi:MAG: glycogen synthase GlgA [Verrucomicrobiae bacterium]|nr:glycogen synthase GlgA [Verrucomicrobiae bacterium]